MRGSGRLSVVLGEPLGGLTEDCWLRTRGFAAMDENGYFRIMG